MILTLSASRQASPHQQFKRLIRPSDYRRTYRQGHRVADHLIRLYYAPNQRKHNRLGVVVSKRISKKATERNWYKRVVKEWFRQHARLCFVVHQDVVVVVVKATLTTKLGSAGMRQELARLSQQIPK